MSANISLNNILVGQTTSTWQEATQIVAAPLVTNRSITEGCIRQMIKSVGKLSPHIVLMPGFALAHTSPGNFVLHIDVSVTTLGEPIDFHSENGPVSVVMCLACTGHTPHIGWLQVIAKRLMESSSIDRITAYKNREELFSLFRE